MGPSASISRKWLRFIGRRGGSTAIEFALLAPIMILLFLGIIAYGIYLGAAHSLQQIAADATRAAVPGLDAAERRALALGYIERHADGYAFIDRARLEVTAGDSEVDPGQFEIATSYDATALPIWNLMDGLVLPVSRIERRSTIRMGGL